MILAGRRVVLGVSGGIACYKACTVARRLSEAGGAVDVVLTAAAAEFVRPLTFEALTGRPVSDSLWTQGSGRALDHIRLARDADLIVVAPATAHLIARAALGLADDLLTTILLAATAPVLLVPAMNDEMYAHPATQTNLSTLTRRGWTTLGPAVGALAEGPSDRPGRMSEPEDIVAVAVRLIQAKHSALSGKRVVVTAGPTREELDPVRVVTNRSSGKMGFALAEAAYSRGADVTLVTGPNVLSPPHGVTVRPVETTDQMRAALGDILPNADVLIMAAAPADYRPSQREADKRPRGDGKLEISLEPTDDILQETRPLRKTGAVIVGFALETTNGLERAKAKLVEKSLDLIVLNSAVEPGSGFEGDTNAVTLVGVENVQELPLLSKREVGHRILDAVERML
jgi:phosphopantothenoylcysteine decarboxylase / phosphopantothenate---cysteine ligase